MGFLIASYPRSGSAWLANLMTTADTFCHHDPTMRMPEEEIKKRLKPVWIGMCGSDMLRDIGKYREPYMPVVLLTRDHREVLSSLAKNQLFRDNWSAVEAAFWGAADVAEELAHDPRVLSVRYEDVFKPHIAGKVWDHCIGHELPFDVERAKQLSRMRVELLDMTHGLEV